MIDDEGDHICVVPDSATSIWLSVTEDGETSGCSLGLEELGALLSVLNAHYQNIHYVENTNFDEKYGDIYGEA